MSTMAFHVSLLTSANHALRGPSASGCVRQKARSVPRLTTRIRFPFSYLNLLPFWEQARWSHGGITRQHPPAAGGHHADLGRPRLFHARVPWIVQTRGPARESATGTREVPGTPMAPAQSAPLLRVGRVLADLPSPSGPVPHLPIPPSHPVPHAGPRRREGP